MNDKYKRYNYFKGVCDGRASVIKGAGMEKYLAQGLEWIGSWYAHENTPYISSDGQVVRMRYGVEVEL